MRRSKGPGQARHDTDKKDTTVDHTSSYLAALPALAMILCPTLIASSATAQTRAYDTVEVRGAQFIPEDDIQRTCGVEANVPYFDLEIRAIEDCLMSTGVFESVKLYSEDGTLIIDVQELDTRPGRIEASLKYASEDGAMAGVSFERYNLFPKTYGAVHLDFNEEVTRGSLNLYRTEVIGEDIDMGFDLVGARIDYDDRSFSQDTLRAEPFLAWTPGDQLRVEMGLGYRTHSLYDIDAGASALLVQEETDDIDAAYLRFSASYASLEDQTIAYLVKLDQFFWNVGTDDPLSDTRLTANAAVPLSEQTTFLAGLRAGTLQGLDDNATRVIDRYFVGADSFRGFAPRGIGPRDGDDALGGNNYLVASFEVQRELGSLGPVPMRGGLFVDLGASWGLDDTLGGLIDDSWHTRSSVGLSLTIDVAKTPVSLYVAKPLQSEPGDEEQVFGLSLSAHF